MATIGRPKKALVVTVEFLFRGTLIRQEEQYFLLRIPPGDVALGQSDHVWSIEEIVALLG
jgi:hypothetical protein